jgi:phosphoribosylanthranilate isomerase
MRNAENIRELERLAGELSINLMGFIFWPKSSRYVSERPAYLPTRCKRVGVFVDEDNEKVKHIADEYALDIIQLHGSESPEYAKTLLRWKLIKAFNIATKEDLEATKPYEGTVDYFLFDTKGKSVGGNGEKFDWSVLEAYQGDTPFLLSGGIGPDDAERIKHFHHPLCMGIDLNSKFEVAPALKDIQKLKKFIEQL